MKINFKQQEKILLLGSIITIFISHMYVGNRDILVLSTSIIGVFSLTFSAKAHPVGPLLMIVFSIMYGLISLSFQYYGEMITYLGMTLPMSVVSFYTWIKNPASVGDYEVRIENMNVKGWINMTIYSLLVTVTFHYILIYLNTSNILFSTISVTTSFIAVYLTYKRSKYFAIGYALNDLILIALWLYASQYDSAYMSMVFTFAAMLANDLYGFYNWRILSRKQGKSIIDKTERKI